MILTVLFCFVVSISLKTVTPLSILRHDVVRHSLTSDSFADGVILANVWTVFAASCGPPVPVSFDDSASSVIVHAWLVVSPVCPFHLLTICPSELHMCLNGNPGTVHSSLT